jgi:hypothetical protein
MGSVAWGKVRVASEADCRGILAWLPPDGKAELVRAGRWMTDHGTERSDVGGGNSLEGRRSLACFESFVTAA